MRGMKGALPAQATRSKSIQRITACHSWPVFVPDVGSQRFTRGPLHRPGVSAYKPRSHALSTGGS